MLPEKPAVLMPFCYLDWPLSATLGLFLKAEFSETPRPPTIVVIPFFLFAASIEKLFV